MKDWKNKKMELELLDIQIIKAGGIIENNSTKILNIKSETEIKKSFINNNFKKLSKEKVENVETKIEEKEQKEKVENVEIKTEEKEQKEEKD